MMKCIDKNSIHFEFNPEIEPIDFSDDGEVIKFNCQDCYCEQIHTDNQVFDSLDMKRNNPVTGPLYIRDAEPGDVLRVEIIELNIMDKGSMCVREGAGIYKIKGNHCRRFSIVENQIVFDKDTRIPIRPMIGVIGTAPKVGRISTQTPGEHGGNLDIKDIGQGSFIFLPVNVPGALLSLGDIHAVQGDGETVVCAMEMSGEVIVKVDVIKNRSDIPTPFILSKESYLTTASGKSLDECSLAAARKMHFFLQEHTTFTDAQCGMLLSLAGNLRISQVVNPDKGCIMEFPITLAKNIMNDLIR